MRLESAKSKLLGKSDIWDIDLPEPRIDQPLTIKFAHKHRGSVRISIGRFLGTDEYKKRQSASDKCLP